MNQSSSVPRLLVSVRDREEALQAVEGGCDILDLKEPARGSLGMVEREVAEEVVAVLNETPVSLALGELSDWQNAESLPRIPAGISYCKIGLSQQAANARWQDEWMDFRTQVEARSSRTLRWIAVVYADFRQAASPTPDEIRDAAANTACEGVLFDTFSKTGGHLFDCLSVAELSNWADQIRESGMLLALAGRLRIEHLPQIRSIGPDIVAVRGGVCRDHSRTSQLETDHVRRFKQELQHLRTGEFHVR